MIELKEVRSVSDIKYDGSFLVSALALSAVILLIHPKNIQIDTPTRTYEIKGGM